MKRVLLDMLVCPRCLPRERVLASQIMETDGEEILTGSLHCNQCGSRYPVGDGIACLLPGPLKEKDLPLTRYESPAVVSSYLWSHYGDLLEDREAATAYLEWAKLMGPGSGLSLDAGCAVGRFTFELGRGSALAIGIDNSHAFIRTARTLMKNGQMKIALVDEGELRIERMIRLPGNWSDQNVEFVVGDAQALPFPANLFSSLASLNVVDKIPFPLRHIMEMNRVAKDVGGQLLFSDPFSWSTDIATKQDWLGGREEGPFSGRGIDNMINLLRGEKGRLSPPWRIEKQGHIWWKIRNHRNHFELIRSCFIKANR